MKKIVATMATLGFRRKQMKYLSVNMFQCKNTFMIFHKDLSPLFPCVNRDKSVGKTFFLWIFAVADGLYINVIFTRVLPTMLSIKKALLYLLKLDLQ